MSVHKRGKVWWYEFEVGGQRISGTLNAKSNKEAQLLESAIIEREQKRQADGAPVAVRYEREFLYFGDPKWVEHNIARLESGLLVRRVDTNCYVVVGRPGWSWVDPGLSWLKPHIASVKRLITLVGPAEWVKRTGEAQLNGLQAWGNNHHMMATTLAWRPIDPATVSLRGAVDVDSQERRARRDLPTNFGEE